MDITIRHVTTADALAVSRLSEQLGYSISEPETAGQIQVIAASDHDIAGVAVCSDKIIGWIHVFYTIRLECLPYCEIGGLVVDEIYRGKGVGKMLIEWSKPWCKNKNCAALRVRSNVKRNEAHKFYEQSGFTEKKQQKVFEIYL